MRKAACALFAAIVLSTADAAQRPMELKYGPPVAMKVVSAQKNYAEVEPFLPVHLALEQTKGKPVEAHEDLLCKTEDRNPMPVTLPGEKAPRVSGQVYFICPDGKEFLVRGLVFSK